MNPYEILKNLHNVITTKTLPCKAVGLFTLIFTTFNQNFFPDELSIKLDYLSDKLQISKHDVIRYRQILEQNNLIKYSCMPGNKNGKFSLIYNAVLAPVNKDSAVLAPAQCHSETSKRKDSAVLAPVQDFNIYNNQDILKQSLKTRENISLYITNNINNTQDIHRKKYLQSIDIDLLIKAINESEWLQNSQDIEFCVNNYVKVVSGKYKSFNKKNENKLDTKEPEFIQHDFSNFDFDSLIDNIDDVKLT